MASMQLSTPSYLKHALKDQHNLVVLLGAACFSLAFASPLPLLVGAAGELLWLLVGPRLPAFRGWVDQRLSAQYLARAELAIEGALGQLTESEAERFLALSRDADELGRLSAQRLSAREHQLGQHGLLELRRTFLDYLFLGQRVTSLYDTTPSTELEQERAELQESYATERELTARMTIRQALNAIQRRISQQAALSGVERTLETRLELLQQVVPRLRDRVSDLGSLALSIELDGALAEIGAAEELELAVDEIIDQPAPSAGP